MTFSGLCKNHGTGSEELLLFPMFAHMTSGIHLRQAELDLAKVCQLLAVFLVIPASDNCSARSPRCRSNSGSCGQDFKQSRRAYANQV